MWTFLVSVLSTFSRYIGKLTGGKIFDSNTKGAPVGSTVTLVPLLSHLSTFSLNSIWVKVKSSKGGIKVLQV